MNLFINSSRFFGEAFKVLYYIVSCHLQIMSFILPFQFDVFDFFFLFAKTYNIMLNKSSGSRHSCIVSDLKENIFRFSPLSIMLAVYLSYKAFIM